MAKFDNIKVHSIEVLKQPLVRLFINYYWIPMLLSFFLFLYGKAKTGLIGLSFYPLYFLGGYMAKSFFQNKIVNTFFQLHETGSLVQNELESLMKGFQMRLNNRIGDIIGIVGGLSILWFYRDELIKLSSIRIDYLLSSIVVIAIDVLLGYVIGVAIWKVVVTAYELRQLAMSGKLKIRPFHPDGCAGLRAIGQLCFSLSFILICIGIFLSGWIIYARLINPEFNGVYRYFEPWFFGGLIVLVIVIILAFFLPMITTHRLMKKKAKLFELKLVALAKRISDLEELLLSQSSRLGYAEPEVLYAKIQSLRNVYSQLQKMPTWPVDFKTFAKFFGAQIPLWIGILTSAVNLWGKFSN